MRTIGPFEVVRQIGEGGMGAVFEVRRPGDPTRYALKLLADADPEVRERFLREGRLLEVLSRHPSVVRVHAVGEAQGRPWILMDLVPGKDLKRCLVEGLLDRTQAVRLLIDVARAVHFANEAGVVHRDLKPANVLVHEDGRALLVDFGVAKDARASALTATGTTLGTPSFMAPEQLDSAKVADRRADVYGLGAVLYYILTRRAPFEGDVISIMSRVLQEPPVPPRAVDPTLPAALEEVCLRALAKSPAERHATAEELARDLERALTPAAPPPRAWVRWAALAPGVAVVAGLGIATTQARRELRASQREASSLERHVEELEASLSAARAQEERVHAALAATALEGLGRGGLPLEPGTVELVKGTAALAVDAASRGAYREARGERREAARAYLDAAEALEADPPRALALFDRAWEVHLPTVLERPRLQTLLRAEVDALAARADARRDPLAARDLRRRAFQLRLLAPAADLVDVSSVIRALGRHPDQVVALAARRWVRSFGIPERIERTVDSSERPADDLFAPTNRLGVYPATLFDAYSEWLLARRDTSLLWTRTSDFLRVMGRADEALAVARVGVELAQCPPSVWSLRTLAVAASLAGEREQASRAALQALQRILHPGDERVLTEHAREVAEVLFLHGHPAEAYTLWSRLALTAGDHWVCAEALRALGDVEGERAARAKAELAPW